MTKKFSEKVLAVERGDEGNVVSITLDSAIEGLSLV